MNIHDKKHQELYAAYQQNLIREHLNPSALSASSVTNFNEFLHLNLKALLESSSSASHSQPLAFPKQESDSYSKNKSHASVSPSLKNIKTEKFSKVPIKKLSPKPVNSDTKEILLPNSSSRPFSDFDVKPNKSASFIKVPTVSSSKSGKQTYFLNEPLYSDIPNDSFSIELQTAKNNQSKKCEPSNLAAEPKTFATSEETRKNSQKLEGFKSQKERTNVFGETSGSYSTIEKLQMMDYLRQLQETDHSGLRTKLMNNSPTDQARHSPYPLSSTLKRETHLPHSTNSLKRETDAVVTKREVSSVSTSTTCSTTVSLISPTTTNSQSTIPPINLTTFSPTHWPLPPTPITPTGPQHTTNPFWPTLHHLQTTGGVGTSSSSAPVLSLDPTRGASSSLGYYMPDALSRSLLVVQPSVQDSSSPYFWGYSGLPPFVTPSMLMPDSNFTNRALHPSHYLHPSLHPTPTYHPTPSFHTVPPPKIEPIATPPEDPKMQVFLANHAATGGILPSTMNPSVPHSVLPAGIQPLSLGASLHPQYLYPPSSLPVFCSKQPIYPVTFMQPPTAPLINSSSSSVIADSSIIYSTSPTSVVPSSSTTITSTLPTPPLITLSPQLPSTKASTCLDSPLQTISKPSRLEEQEESVLRPKISIRNLENEGAEKVMEKNYPTYLPIKREFCEVANDEIVAECLDLTIRKSKNTLDDNPSIHKVGDKSQYQIEESVPDKFKRNQNSPIDVQCKLSSSCPSAPPVDYSSPLNLQKTTDVSKLHEETSQQTKPIDLTGLELLSNVCYSNTNVERSSTSSSGYLSSMETSSRNESCLVETTSTPYRDSGTSPHTTWTTNSSLSSHSQTLTDHSIKSYIEHPTKLNSQNSNAYYPENDYGYQDNLSVLCAAAEKVDATPISGKEEETSDSSMFPLDLTLNSVMKTLPKTPKAPPIPYQNTSTPLVSTNTQTEEKLFDQAFQTENEQRSEEKSFFSESSSSESQTFEGFEEVSGVKPLSKIEPVRQEYLKSVKKENRKRCKSESSRKNRGEFLCRATPAEGKVLKLTITGCSSLLEQNNLRVKRSTFEYSEDCSNEDTFHDSESCEKKKKMVKKMKKSRRWSSPGKSSVEKSSKYQRDWSSISPKTHKRYEDFSDEDELKYIKYSSQCNYLIRNESSVESSDHELASSSKKRKPGRPRKHSPTKKDATETIVAKKQKAFNLVMSRGIEGNYKSKVKPKLKAEARPIQEDEMQSYGYESDNKLHHNQINTSLTLCEEKTKKQQKLKSKNFLTKKAILRDKEQRRNAAVSQMKRRDIILKYKNVSNSFANTEHDESDEDTSFLDVKTENEETIDTDVTVDEEVRSHISPTTCEVVIDDIKKGDRVLLLKEEDKMLYAGTIDPILANNIYEITVDGERGGKKEILCKDQVLKSVWNEVKPGSSRFLTKDTRVCCFWSSNNRALYSGKVGSPLPSHSATDSSTHNCVNVEFDDGDSGQINVNDIRLLPPNYPITIPQPNLLETYPRKRKCTSRDSVDSRASTCSNNSSKRIKLEESEEVTKQSESSPSAEPSNAVDFGPVSYEVVEAPKHSKVKKKKKKSEKGEDGKKHRSKHKSKKYLGLSNGHLEKDSWSCSFKNEPSTSNSFKIESSTVPTSQQKENTEGIRSSFSNEDRPQMEIPDALESVNRVSDEQHDTSVLHRDGFRSQRTLSRNSTVSYKEEDEEDIEDDEDNMEEVEEESEDNEEKKIRKKSIPGNSNKSHISSMLHPCDIWKWSGPGRKGKTKAIHYRGIYRDNADGEIERININDIVKLYSIAPLDNPLIGRVHKFYEYHNTKTVEVHWFYHPEELPENLQRSLRYEKGALFSSNHSDKNDIQTIFAVGSVVPLAEYKARCKESKMNNNDRDGDNEEVEEPFFYYLAGHHDIHKGTLKMEPGVE